MPLLRPSELARFWELHPKTVYGWIREGKLPAFRTPGAQYRVRADDARAYGEKNALPPLPRAVLHPHGCVGAIGKPSPALRALERACKARGTALLAWPGLLEGLLAVAREPPDVLVLDARTEGAGLSDVVRALRRTDGTSGLAVVVHEVEPAKRAALAKLGVVSLLARADAADLVEAVMAALAPPEKGA